MAENEKNQTTNSGINVDIDPLTKLLVSDVFAKHNITDEAKRELTNSQKETILAMVQDLQRKADEFVKKTQDRQQDNDQNNEKPVKASRKNALRERIRQKKAREKGNE
ncbi:spore coat protein [Bacillus mojavensis]|uniref:spore coat protein n=1 Tax=Bacillus mojavensis TaxID=72360 RepID=UPI002DB8EF52|nr:spore coat protein [Bacillus mojavensis]MEC1635620.1 spore coat protein [Bacillus mojavensis]MEC1682787.1 spore coat protein [Bacillus mojavensis]MEC1707175.1 spore coat protein [Bacillus mojavensis]MEC1733560.1 spore coat protein [Bacillus mojavensis]MED1005565.1 spore coat protein [Bacillus mojavensis]